MEKRPAVFLVGGFLGAGKATAISALAKLFAKRCLKATAITNDQAQGVDGNGIALLMTQRMADDISERKAMIGHLKLLAAGETGSVKTGITVAGQRGELTGAFSGPVSHLHVTLNARATVSPNDFTEILTSMMASFKCGGVAETVLTYLNTFRPSSPNPTYRYAGLSGERTMNRELFP
jgi:hypothetical protein